MMNSKYYQIRIMMDLENLILMFIIKAIMTIIIMITLIIID